ncbi:hypothetical protein BDK51DRAFT_44973 [Blyttiomyces helicus]|uniref:Uncharacterized protein n=1 Tax=Blyttiomyces helicus TaxID=388810 RepID=A0A4P9VUW7_9FUNG|nr:hypothetical protein BDK51DRAFT_44973 [Blyttiomyces helicus]|eukprot:RKO83409.1 hypothetical protein BDK51DRAFT_44973 [Blyttiomyces helicus]
MALARYALMGSETLGDIEAATSCHLKIRKRRRPVAGLRAHHFRDCSCAQGMGKFLTVSAAGAITRQMTISTPLDTLIIVGGSGGVGKEIATQALANPFFKKVTILSRGAATDDKDDVRVQKRALLADLAARGGKVVELYYSATDDARLIEEFKGHKVAVLLSYTDSDDPEGPDGWKRSIRMIDIAKV